MRINITDLPLNLQKQALKKLAEEDERRRHGNENRNIERTGNGIDHQCLEDMSSKSKRNGKYNAKKVTLPLPDGTDHEFDSKREAAEYSDLYMREQSGEISDLRIQVPYVLIPSQVAPSGKKYRECKYIADFVYTDNATGETVVEDAKGYRTKEYALKKKLMLKVWGIEIKEV